MLSACLQGRRDLLDKALRHLQPEHFADQSYRNIFIVAQRYYDVTGAVVTRTAFADLLSNAGADPSRIALYTEQFDALTLKTPQDHEFVWSVKALQEERAYELTGRAITAGLEQLQGVVDPPKHLESLPPAARARAVLLEELAKIDRELNMADAPEGDVRVEAKDMLDDYSARVSLAKTGRNGVLLGIPDIDLRTGGLQNGDLVLIAGFTAVGKSQLCVQLAWDVSVVQGRNVFFATSETIRAQVRRRIVARHSRLPQFALPDGLNSRDLKAGTLPEHLEPKLREVVSDLTSGQYGKLHLAQIPRGASIATLESRLHSAQRTWDIDLVVVDYLALLTPERKREAGWAELSDMMKSTKQLCTTFADGRGVPIVSPWQMSRQAFERSQKSGHYALPDLSETAEAEKSPDLVMSLLKTQDDETGRHIELRAQILKNRDGEIADSVPLTADYATCLFTAPRSGSAIQSLLDE